MTEVMKNKSPEIKSFIEAVFPGTMKAIESKQCPSCGNPVSEFRDELSKREYLISGLCQDCQDRIFG